MRWNCPHCGNSLSLSPAEMPNGWAFSQCQACSGFALVRLGARSIIKLDSVPRGEQVLTPSCYQISGRTEISTQLQPDGSIGVFATESRREFQSHESSHELSHNTAHETALARPLIKPAQRKPSIPATREDYTREAAHFAQMAAATEIQADLRRAQANAMTEIANEVKKSVTGIDGSSGLSGLSGLSGKTVPFPAPLPEPPPRSEGPEIRPIALGLVAAVLFASAFLHFT